MKFTHASPIQEFTHLQRSLEELNIPSSDEDYKRIEGLKNSALLLIETTFGNNQVAKQFIARIQPLFTEPLSIGFGDDTDHLSEEEKKDVFETSITDAKAILSECIQLLDAR